MKSLSFARRADGWGADGWGADALPIVGILTYKGVFAAKNTRELFMKPRLHNSEGK
jgi:hypothetical protein